MNETADFAQKRDKSRAADAAGTRRTVAEDPHGDAEVRADEGVRATREPVAP